MTGIPLKTLHDWCTEPKECEHKSTSKANMKKEEFHNFLMQDTISYSHPCKRYSGKKFLLHTLDEVYKRYEEQMQFHKHGKISRTAMHMYKPKNVLLVGKMPVNQCLCDYCENCNLLMKALVAVGIKGLPLNRYACVDTSFCTSRHGQFGTSYAFASRKCIRRECSECRSVKLRVKLQEINSDLLQLNRSFTWHQWKIPEGRSAPQKSEVRGTL